MGVIMKWHCNLIIVFICIFLMTGGFPGGSNSNRICLQCRRSRFDPLVRKIPWRREWLPTPVFLLGEFHGLRSLVGYSPWGWKQLDRTERLILSGLESEADFSLCSPTQIAPFSFRYMNWLGLLSSPPSWPRDLSTGPKLWLLLAWRAWVELLLDGEVAWLYISIIIKDSCSRKS